MDFLKDSEQYLKIDDAARLLGVSRRWVYRRIWSGELPAAKVGGLYFILRSDLEEVLDERRAERRSKPVIADPVKKCGYCLRLLPNDAFIAGMCSEEGCEKPICAQCQAEGIQYCAQHSPAPSQKMQEMRQRFESGEVRLFVQSETARMQEINFLNRIQRRIESMSNLIHPVSGELLTIDNWEGLREKGDDRLQVMRLQNKVVLSNESLARTPLNAYLAYAIPQQKRQKGPALCIWTQTLSRLAVMLQDGCDTQPLDVQELQPWLVRFSEEAERAKTFQMVVLASSTGWSQRSCELIQGKTSGSALMHNLLLIYLYDLLKGSLIYNIHDERARAYTELFIPLLPGEQLEEAKQLIENELILHRSLALNHAIQLIPSSPDLVQRAFEALAASGNYSLIQMPEYGQVIARKID